MGESWGLHVVAAPSWWPSAESPLSGVFFTDYVRAFARDGAKVGVVFPDLVSVRHVGRAAGAGLRPRLIWEELYGVPVLRIRGFHTALGRPAWQMGRYRRWLRWGLRAYRARFGEPDVLHAMIAAPAGWACTHLDDPLARRVVLTEETGPFDLAMNPPAQAAFVREAMAKAARVVTVSGPSLADITSHEIDRPIETCGNPVAEEFLTGPVVTRRRDGAVRALFVGRIVASKGVLELTEAAAVLGRQVSIEWHFVGDGPEAAAVQDQFAKAGLADRLVMHGTCPRERVVELMAESDLLVLPTHYETFGQAAAEALCMGLPVVTTRGTACEEFLNETSGVAVEMKNPASLADGIRRVIDRLDLYDRAAIAARARQRFSGTAVARFYAKLFREVVEADRRTPGGSLNTSRRFA